MEASNTMDSNLNILRPVSSANKIRAHQNPPNPEDKITNALAVEDAGMTENRELNTINTANTADIASSAGVHAFLVLRTNTQQAIKATAQKIPDKTFARSPGMTAK